MSQQELADKCSLSRHSIMRYENNSSLPDLISCNKIAEGLNIDPALLYDDYLSFIANNYGQNIKKARLNINLTQKQLAYRLNIKQSTISEWELEHKLPSRENFLILKSFFKNYIHS